MSNQNRKPRIVILYATAGGGHKSGAEALIEAIHIKYGQAVETEMIDVVNKDYSPSPFDHVPQAYAQMIKSPQFWKQFYGLGDGQRRARIITHAIALYTRRHARDLLAKHPADLYVSVYHFANTPVLDVLKRQSPNTPFVTVVTDLVNTPPVWYDPRATLCTVPTSAASEHAKAAGVDPERIKIIGLPVSPRFNTASAPPASLRHSLGWPQDIPMVLLMAGGEGVGPITEIASALATSGLTIGLAIVTGRNYKLKSKLEHTDWPIPVFVYGFSRHIPDLMHASTIFITKAGPGNISEATVSGLPLIIYSQLYGQEQGNVEFVTSKLAGVWAPKPEQIVAAVSRWVEDPLLLQDYRSNSKKLGNPEAAFTISDELVKLARSHANSEA